MNTRLCIDFVYRLVDSIASSTHLFFKLSELGFQRIFFDKRVQIPILATPLPITVLRLLLLLRNLARRLILLMRELLVIFVRRRPAHTKSVGIRKLAEQNHEDVKGPPETKTAEGKKHQQTGPDLADRKTMYTQITQKQCKKKDHPTVVLTGMNHRLVGLSCSGGIIRIVHC